MRARVVEFIIRVMLRVTRTYLTHDGGYELFASDWGVETGKEFRPRGKFLR